ncbi:peptide-methionine (R)-S-oxide reductase [Candidatus Kaiserbacteria bacterium CG10_big_fil_rev_8_21_14_0_10_49_17]|uniref:peptide-methionine (R)-S-oxide reductase n=1 Tax=Candidatus Kaiserbacteria bacterium CG10_big_fil_rev_8_21_14_0_10_49_17 TaxID=1974609 RepID=A0A2M6WEV0_9BACT|nr:MAG: peptide-methionine (R)-S-oxide reductase [Candidatus Kaiserbacteria bacterium CG10_big_fil_rev_8_21_14_0_10_49_17]
MKDKPESYWKEKLTPEQYKIVREKGTEEPFTGELLHNKEDGVYRCAACGTPLFSSNTKFDSGSGWPSFTDVIEKGNVELIPDDSHGMHRTEVICATCGGHLGHVFEDLPSQAGGPKEGGKRYCINSCSLDFKEE